jgi:Ca2+-binding EF-hand superfamily protein
VAASAANANADAMAVADENKDGRLSDDEARKGVDAVLREANAKEPSDRGRRLVSEFDANKDKKLDESEATLAVVAARRTTAQGKRLDDAFKGLDENRDGVVDKREFEKLPDKIGAGGRWMRRRTGEMFRDFDTNNDGKITPVEGHMNAGVLGMRFGGRGQRDAPDSAPAPVDPLRDAIEKQFALLDRDRDQQLSEKEYRGNKDLRLRARQMDLDLDQELTVEEIYAFYEAHPEKK